ncbi:MAG: hypothetical protein ACRC2M_24115, partial [Planktothrix sp.]
NRVSCRDVPWRVSLSMARLSIHGASLFPWRVSLSMARLSFHGASLFPWRVSLSLARLSTEIYFKAFGLMDAPRPNKKI